jgi:cephalosporin-C deacetylase-like acetyl esterase
MWLVGFFAFCSLGAKDIVLINFQADKTNCLYKAGQTAKVAISATDEAGNLVTSGTDRVAVDDCGTNLLYVGKLDFSKSNPIVLESTLNEPGFVRYMVRKCHAIGFLGKPLYFPRLMYSVGFDVEKIKKASPDIADFDEFWSNAIAKLDKEVPIDVQRVEVPEKSTKHFTFYRISFATFGRRIYAYMSIPKKKSESGKFPIEISVSSAGFGDYSNDMPGKRDRINVFFTVHPFEPHWNWRETGLEKVYEKYESDLMKKYRVTSYANAGITEERENYFFYNVILGINRAVTYLSEMDIVDKKNIWYQGTSQGGGFGLYLCGLNHCFTRAVLQVPGMTDEMGLSIGRRSGWPYLLEIYKKDRPEEMAIALKNVPYFDGANFASRIKCPVRVVIGFGDLVCPPTTVYATYNEIKVKDKAIINCINMAHDVFPETERSMRRWMSERQ